MKEISDFIYDILFAVNILLYIEFCFHKILAVLCDHFKYTPEYL